LGANYDDLSWVITLEASKFLGELGSIMEDFNALSGQMAISLTLLVQRKGHLVHMLARDDGTLAIAESLWSINRARGHI